MRRCAGFVLHLGGCILAALVAGSPLACDKPGRAEGKSNSVPAPGDGSGEARLAAASQINESARTSLLAFFQAAHKRDFDYLFSHCSGYQQPIQTARREHPDDFAVWVAQYKAEEAARFARGDCEADLQELVDLLAPRHQVEVRSAAATGFVHLGTRYERVVRCEVQILYESPAQAAIYEGNLLKRATLNLVMDGPTGRYITSSRLRSSEEIYWESIPLMFYAADTQPGAGETVIQVRLLGGKLPISLCLRNGSTVLWRKIREGERSGLVSTARFAIRQGTLDQWFGPDQCTLAAYDAAGEFQAVNLTGGRWCPPEIRAYSENRVWWIADPWRIAWQANHFGGIHEARERGLLLGLAALNPADRQQLIQTLNAENEARARQQAGIKVTRENSRTMTEFSIVPEAWSVPFSFPGTVIRWDLDTGGKRVEAMLSNGDRFGVGSGRIEVPPGESIYFRSLEATAVPAKLIVQQSGG